jgi:hypothetical protein
MLWILDVECIVFCAVAKHSSNMERAYLDKLLRKENELIQNNRSGNLQNQLCLLQWIDMLLTLAILSLLSQQVLTITYSCDPSASCGCSSSPASLSRILGGEPALNNTWGWAVSILFNDMYYCAGTNGDMPLS